MNRKKIRGFLQLVRPELPFAAGVCVVLGQIVALGKVPAVLDLLLGFSWAFLLAAPAMILNDYFDIEVDKINAPGRPLASGLITPGEASVLAASLSLIGLTAALFISSSAVVLYFVFWIIGFIYNCKLKESGLLGNLMVSSSVAVTFILGGIAVGELSSPVIWVLAAMVFLINLGEEIAADAMDMEGDIKRGVKSVASIVGQASALRISMLLFVFAVAASLVPALWGLLGISYLLTITLTDVAILFFGIKLLRSKTRQAGRIAIRGVYLSGLVGVLVIILSTLVLEWV